MEIYLDNAMVCQVSGSAVGTSLPSLQTSITLS